MPQKLLEDFQAHAGVEKLGGEGVTKAMHRVALVEPCLLDVFDETAPGGAVADGPDCPVRKRSILLLLVPYREPAL